MKIVFDEPLAGYPISFTHFRNSFFTIHDDDGEYLGYLRREDDQEYTLSLVDGPPFTFTEENNTTAKVFAAQVAQERGLI